jgi:hypothetical protein
VSAQTLGPIARVLDPPYSRLFSNPLITAQAKRLLEPALEKAGWDYVHGTLYARVYASFIVTRVDRLDDADFQHSSRPQKDGLTDLSNPPR